jgi:hypothetical protein
MEFMSEEQTKERKYPPVRGKITVEGLLSARFWIRVFGLEEHIAFAQVKIDEKPERKMAAVPIINEYEVDPERLCFYYALSFQVDNLGVRDVIGAVFYADKDNAKEALEHRNKLADMMIATIHSRKWDEQMEAYITESGKEQ